MNIFLKTRGTSPSLPLVAMNVKLVLLECILDLIILVFCSTVKKNTNSSLVFLGSSA